MESTISTCLLSIENKVTQEYIEYAFRIDINPIMNSQINNQASGYLLLIETMVIKTWRTFKKR